MNNYARVREKQPRAYKRARAERDVQQQQQREINREREREGMNKFASVCVSVCLVPFFVKITDDDVSGRKK